MLDDQPAADQPLVVVFAVVVALGVVVVVEDQPFSDHALELAEGVVVVVVEDQPFSVQPEEDVSWDS